MDEESRFAEARSVQPSMLVPLLSALIPGAGDLWLSRSLPKLRRRSMVFLGIAILGLAIYTLGGLCHSYWAFWVAKSWFLVNFGSAFLTYRSLYKNFHAGKLLVLLLVAAIFGQGTVKGCIYLYGIRDYEIPGISFEPTILQKENIWCDESLLARRNLRRGDVVTLGYKEVFYVKRLVAFGGDEVMALDGRLQVNGKPLDVPFFQTGQESDEAPRNFGPIYVPAGAIFVIGDNRDVSLDSRTAEFGYPPQSALRGRAYFIRTSPDPKRVGIAIH